LERFASGRRMYVVQHAERCMSALEVITRARSRLGEKDYRLLTNNCEHFVEWCLHDESRSFQAETALAYPRALGERIETALLGVVRRVVVARTPARVRIEERQEQERR
jgi:hypothetical protein